LLLLVDAGAAAATAGIESKSITVKAFALPAAFARSCSIFLAHPRQVNGGSFLSISISVRGGSSSRQSSHSCAFLHTQHAVVRVFTHSRQTLHEHWSQRTKVFTLDATQNTQPVKTGSAGFEAASLRVAASRSRCVYTTNTRQPNTNDNHTKQRTRYGCVWTEISLIV
jgi:hypothetical protein